MTTQAADRTRLDGQGRVIAVTGTSTDVGKTIATAALAAIARAHGMRVGVCKPVQTGVGPDEPGDLAVIAALTGALPSTECARYPEPLAPVMAARRSGIAQVGRLEIDTAVTSLASGCDLTLIEGAGGVMVRLADELDLLDVAAAHDAGVVVVSQAGLGALNHAELTVDAVRAAGCRPIGLVIGNWPVTPDLAALCNREDLAEVTGVPLVGVIPSGVGNVGRSEFLRRAPDWFDPGWVRSELLLPASAATSSSVQAPAVATA